LTITSVDSDVTGRDDDISRSRRANDCSEAEELGGSEVTGSDADRT
jgi:hypothetical protein